ncbi:hypothetical protein KC340_g1253 [Hortaea werneckii]|nr:hypothetical protein KC342_g1226 [Hortaea werneckii]KAI7106838.1 hypothetical protein KC339_g2823 [Hortaea werneckii]KAI7245350.1 hypothetical protein KC365_g548 [Hortaea werneckii]KAI7337434.1 hypothetical protein KC340_g1253 [Hortaea werneckii]KAI7405615.1 hypothetical protein KC328_g1343 [Hortaea werneckii]
MKSWYEIKPSLERSGLGVFAARTIPPGTVIMHDRAIMKLKLKHVQFTDEEVRDSFNLLSDADKIRVLKLHEGHRPFKTKLMRIYKANSFGAKGFTKLHVDISRVNHSCVPNADKQDDTEGDEKTDAANLVAIRTIAQGEEILICYNSNFEGMTVTQRNNILDSYYSFRCSCPACTLPPKERILSDTRRRLINVLSSICSGFEPVDLSQLDHLNRQNAENPAMAMGRPQFPLHVALPISEKTAFSILLAELMQAEHLTNVFTADLYRVAAYHLMQQMSENRYILVIPSACFVTVWMEKAIKIVSNITGAHSEQTRAIKAQWNDWQKGEQLDVYQNLKPTYLDALARAKGADKVFFAAHIGETAPNAEGLIGLKIEVLSEQVCKMRLREGKGKVSCCGRHA